MQRSENEFHSGAPFLPLQVNAVFLNVISCGIYIWNSSREFCKFNGQLLPFVQFQFLSRAWIIGKKQKPIDMRNPLIFHLFGYLLAA